MKREIFTIDTRETSAKVQQSEINSVRVKDILKRGVRVYDGSGIGISGAVGDVPLEQLTQEAVENLATGIAYPFPLEANQIIERDYTQGKMTPEEMLAHGHAVLATLKEAYSDFSFSERIGVKEVTHSLENTEGLELVHRDAVFSLELVLKEKSSANLFDGFLFYQGRGFDPERFWAFNRSYLEAYRKPVALPTGEKLPVFFVSSQAVEGILNKSLNGERYGNGSSLFKGRIGDQLFNEKVNLSMYRGKEMLGVPFFDAEGVVLTEDKLPLIEKGKLLRVFADKKTSAEYGLPLTGGASSDYDGKPKLQEVPLRFETDSVSISEDLAGQPGILVVVAAGGDFTASGDYASPVQVSFLFDGNQIIGKLPEFTVKSNLDQMLGVDYIGTYDSPFYLGEGLQLQGYHMTIL